MYKTNKEQLTTGISFVSKCGCARDVNDSLGSEQTDIG